MLYLNYKKHNEGKNIFAAAKTPATLFTLVLILYFASGIFNLIGMIALANLCNLVMGVVLLTLCLWTYIRYVFTKMKNLNFKNYNHIKWDVSVP